MANFIPWKGTNAITDPTKQLNAQYTSSATNGFAIGDTVTALSTNAALRMTTLVSAAVAKIFNFDSMSIDSALDQIVNTFKANLGSAFSGTVFTEKVLFNGGADFSRQTGPLSIGKVSKIQIYENTPFVENQQNFVQNSDYGLGCFYTVKEAWATGLESKFFVPNPSTSGDVNSLYKVSIHGFLDFITPESSATEDNTTVFEIQKQNNSVFLVRPNGSTSVKEVYINDAMSTTSQYIRLTPYDITILSKTSSNTQTITWAELFTKIGKIT